MEDVKEYLLSGSEDRKLTKLSNFLNWEGLYLMHKRFPIVYSNIIENRLKKGDYPKGSKFIWWLKKHPEYYDVNKFDFDSVRYLPKGDTFTLIDLFGNRADFPFQVLEEYEYSFITEKHFNNRYNLYRYIKSNSKSVNCNFVFENIKKCYTDINILFKLFENNKSIFIADYNKAIKYIDYFKPYLKYLSFFTDDIIIEFIKHYGLKESVFFLKNHDYLSDELIGKLLKIYDMDELFNSLGKYFPILFLEYDDIRHKAIDYIYQSHTINQCVKYYPDTKLFFENKGFI